jgi:hypothetical protein
MPRTGFSKLTGGVKDGLTLERSRRKKRKAAAMATR